MVAAKPPALHRFPRANAKRIQDLCQVLVRRYDGEAANVWAGVDDGALLVRRVGELPGFGDQFLDPPRELQRRDSGSRSVVDPGMETPDHEYGMTEAHRYRVAQANRLVRYCIDQGADIAAVLTRTIPFDFTPICGPDGEIVPEEVDLALADYA